MKQGIPTFKLGRTVLEKPTAIHTYNRCWRKETLQKLILSLQGECLGEHRVNIEQDHIISIIYIVTLMEPRMGHKNGFWGHRNGPAHRYQNGPLLPEAPTCLCLQCFVSKLVLAFFGGVSPNCRVVVFGTVLHWVFWKCSAFDMPKHILAMCRQKVGFIF